MTDVRTEGAPGCAAASASEREALELLQRLIRFNTVNPPGDERPAQEHLAAHLQAAATSAAVWFFMSSAPRPHR